MAKIKPLIPLLFLSAFFTACGNRPFHVLSDKKMEAVLFDVYIAQVEMDNNRTVFSDSARKADLLNTVFQKHKIDKTDFDSSLEWYSDNLEKYAKLNEKIAKRYAKMAEDLRAEQAGNLDEQTQKELADRYPIDSVPFFLRRADLPQNIYTFEADTVLHEYNGIWDLRFNVCGLPSKIRPIVTFCVQCSDTTIVRRDSI
ncbi:MAG: DUF4296 domain-containing protein [Dysgonamonadaceae bacterium]|jgi:hypothetical protein|nr:DUF4296 domain-containing protein [Dysgonamonadaceae bacterium]